MLVFSGVYYSTKDKLRDFKPKTSKVGDYPTEEEKPDTSWIKGDYSLLLTQDKFPLNRRTSIKPRKQVLRTKPVKAIGSIGRIKQEANDMIRLKREVPHKSLTLKGMIYHIILL